MRHNAVDMRHSVSMLGVLTWLMLTEVGNVGCSHLDDICGMLLVTCHALYKFSNVLWCSVCSTLVLLRGVL
jgi:hypothetical protein